MKVEKVKSKDEIIPTFRLLDSENKEIKSVTNFLSFLKIKNYSPNTIKNYAFDLKYYFGYLDSLGKRYESIAPWELVDFLNYIKNYNDPTEKHKRRHKLLSASTIKRILASISSFYTWHEISTYLPSTINPQIRLIDYKVHPVTLSYKSFLSFAQKRNQVKSNFIRIKQIKRIPRPLEKEDFRLLLKSLNSWRDKAILFLGYQGGMRIGEILGLCFEDINFRKKEITIRFRDNNPNQARVKGMRERVIFIEEPEALSCLNHYVLYERPESSCPYLFLSLKGKSRGLPLTYQGIYTVFDHHCKKLLLKKKFTFHSLRHTHATKMYEGGMSLLSLQKRLGHSSPQTTQIYTQVSDETLKEEYLKALGLGEILK